MRFSHKRWVYLVIGGIICTCCGQSGKTSEDKRIAKILGQVVHLPPTLHTIQPNTGTLFNDTSTIKFVSYFNAEGCTSCKLKDLYTWRRLLHQEDSLPQWRSLFCIFIFNTSKMVYPEQTLSTYRFNHPMIIDSLGDFERANPGLPTNPQFHTFLLDRNNHVVLVGSPIGNPKMWELYKSTIARLVDSGGTLANPEMPRK